MPKHKEGQLVFWTAKFLSGDKHTIGRVFSILWENGFQYYVIPIMIVNTKGVPKRLTGRSRYKMSEDQLNSIPEDKLPMYEAYIKATETQSDGSV